MLMDKLYGTVQPVRKIICCSLVIIVNDDGYRLKLEVSFWASAL